jgi:hypothetical protein
MKDIVGQSGNEPNFVTDKELEEWTNIMKSFNVGEFNQTGHGEYIGSSHGVDKNNKKGYLWFDRIVMRKLRDFFGEDLKLIFSQYVDCNKPIAKHNDIFDWISVAPYISLVIPCSVDNNSTDCKKASTIIETPDNKIIKQVWNSGNMIWWDSTLQHWSGDFDTFSNKQMIVCHTYVNEK